MVKNSRMASSQQVAKRAREVGGGWCTPPPVPNHRPAPPRGPRVRPKPSSNSGVAGKLATTSTGPKNHQGWRW